MEGYLKKANPHAAKGIKVWQKRYFVFTVGEKCTLSYFGDEQESRSGPPRGLIALGGAAVQTKEDNRPTRFDIVDPSGRKYKLDAATPAEADSWVRILGAGVKAATAAAATAAAANAAELPRRSAASSASPALPRRPGRSAAPSMDSEASASRGSRGRVRCS